MDIKKVMLFSLFFVIVLVVGFISGFLAAIIDPRNTERLSPTDISNYTDLLINDNMACLLMKNLTMSTIAPTNSMDPVLDKEAIILRYKPNNISDIHPGDIVSYRLDKEVIIHRVIKINGDVITMKGDNNKFSEKIKFEDIVGKMVAIIY